MEILTRTSKSVVKKDEKSRITATICDEEIIFSGKALREFNIKPGTRLVFVIDVGRLYFYLAKKDSDEGFELKEQINKEGYKYGRIQGVRLIRVLRERFPSLKAKSNRKHIVRFSNTQINECLTFEILVDKRL